MAKSGRSQGGLIGKINTTSFGKCKVTTTTATGTFTTQPGTTKLYSYHYSRWWQLMQVVEVGLVVFILLKM